MRIVMPSNALPDGLSREGIEEWGIVKVDFVVNSVERFSVKNQRLIHPAYNRCRWKHERSQLTMSSKLTTPGKPSLPEKLARPAV